MEQSLEALFDLEPTNQTDKRCVIGLAVDDMPDKYKTIMRQQLGTAWRSGGHTDYDISDVLQRAGYKASPTSVNRHRNNKCVCPKEAK